MPPFANNQLPAVANELWAAEVHQQFQQTVSELRSTVTLRTGIVGEVYRFRSMAATFAEPWNQGSDSSSSNLPGGNEYAFQDLPGKTAKHNVIPCTLEQYVAHCYTDIFENDNMVNFDERRELARSLAAAINRRQDQLVLDKLGDGAAGLTTVGDAAKLFSIETLRDLKYEFDRNHVPEGDRVIVCHAKAVWDMLGDEKLTSSDFQQVKALADGGNFDGRTLLGFRVVSVGDGGKGLHDTASAGDIADTTGMSAGTAYAFHKSCVGLAIGKDVSVELNRIAEKLAWLSAVSVRAGACLIDTTGIRKVVHISGA